MKSTFVKNVHFLKFEIFVWLLWNIFPQKPKIAKIIPVQKNISMALTTRGAGIPCPVWCWVRCYTEWIFSSARLLKYVRPCCKNTVVVDFSFSRACVKTRPENQPEQYRFATSVLFVNDTQCRKARWWDSRKTWSWLAPESLTWAMSRSSIAGKTWSAMTKTGFQSLLHLLICK